jgi:MFS family permease
MMLWGLLSAATLFTRGELSFCLLRLLLGAAEAGFFPGVILYLTYWFPDRIRGQMMGLFYLGVPFAFVLGSPLSGLLLTIPGWLRLQGWQWMFLVEGLLAVLGGLAAFFSLDDNPSSAAWLPDPERRALLAVLAHEESLRRTRGPSSFLATLRNPRVLHCALIYFLIQIGVYGVIFYLPADVASLLGTTIGLRVGLVSAVPWIFSLAATFWLPRLADRTRRHRSLAAVALFASSIAIFLLPLAEPSAGSSTVSLPHAAIALSALCVAASGLIAVQPVFWTFPTRYLSGTAAAGGIALISGLANLGGLLAPNIRIQAEIHFHSHSAGPFALAALTLPNALLVAVLARKEKAQVISGTGPGVPPDTAASV